MEINFQNLVQVIRRWGWIVLVLTVVGGVVGYGLSSLQSPSYSATTSLLVTAPTSTTIVENENRAQTYRSLVESGPVLDRVIAELDLAYDREELSENVEASVILNTQIIEITVSDESADRAADIANSTARNFENQVADLTVGQLERNLDDLQMQADQLRTRQAEIDTELTEIDIDANAEDTDVQARIETLNAERLSVSQTLADLDASIRNVNEQLVTSTTPVAVADVAQVAQDPDSPRPLLIGILGAFLGFLIGAGIVAVVAFMDNKVRPETHIEEITASRMLGLIPNDTGTEKDGRPYAIADSNAPATEAVRKLRTRLGNIAKTDAHSAVVVTGTDAASGSSMVATNLAVVMAQSGLRTVLVDANFRDPYAHGAFGIKNDAGLSTLLGDPAQSWSSVAFQPGSLPLQVVPAGPAPQNPSELLSSDVFTTLLDRIKNEMDIVVVDAPLALAYSDALSVASHAEGIVLVARYGHTRQDELQYLAGTIDEDGMRLLGVVMNRV